MKRLLKTGVMIFVSRDFTLVGRCNLPAWVSHARSPIIARLKLCLGCSGHK